MAFLNSPIITYTQILVHRWGTRTRISVLFPRWTKGNVALQGLVPAVDPAPPPLLTLFWAPGEDEKFFFKIQAPYL